MIGYVYLLLTIIIESAAIVCMKMANGIQNKVYLTAGITLYTCTFFLLTMALKYLPLGYTNALWAGASTVIVYIFGIYYFKDKTSLLEIFFVLCIVVGIIGLNFLGKGK